MEIREVVPGFHRGPRPQSLADIFWLKDQGVKHVFNVQGFVLEELQVLEESAWCVSVGVGFGHFPLDLLRGPSPADMRRAVELIGALMPGVYLHCHDGVDRTGMVCAAYRILQGHVTVGGAAGEMIDDGFHLESYDYWIKQLKGL